MVSLLHLIWKKLYFRKLLDFIKEIPTSSAFHCQPRILLLYYSEVKVWTFIFVYFSFPLSGCVPIHLSNNKMASS